MYSSVILPLETGFFIGKPSDWLNFSRNDVEVNWKVEVDVEVQHTVVIQRYHVIVVTTVVFARKECSQKCVLRSLAKVQVYRKLIYWNINSLDVILLMTCTLKVEVG